MSFEFDEKLASAFGLKFGDMMGFKMPKAPHFFNSIKLSCDFTQLNGGRSRSLTFLNLKEMEMFEETLMLTGFRRPTTDKVIISFTFSKEQNIQIFEIIAEFWILDFLFNAILEKLEPS